MSDVNEINVFDRTKTVQDAGTTGPERNMLVIRQFGRRDRADDAYSRPNSKKVDS